MKLAYRMTYESEFRRTPFTEKHVKEYIAPFSNSCLTCSIDGKALKETSKSPYSQIDLSTNGMIPFIVVVLGTQFIDVLSSIATQSDFTVYFRWTVVLIGIALFTPAFIKKKSISTIALCSCLLIVFYLIFRGVQIYDSIANGVVDIADRENFRYYWYFGVAIFVEMLTVITSLGMSCNSFRALRTIERS